MTKISLQATRRNRQFKQASVLAHYGEESRAAKLIACAREDYFRARGQLSRFRCQQGRDCFYCAPLAARRTRHKYAARIADLIYAGCQLCLLTLTIPSSYSINEDIYRSLWCAFKKLKRRAPFCKTWLGILARIETNFNFAYQTFHPHIHALIVYKNEIPSKRQIAAAWRDLTTAAIVSVEYITLKDHQVEPIVERVFVYLLKFTDFDSEYAFAIYHAAVKKVRLIAAYGLLRGRYPSLDYIVAQIDRLKTSRQSEEQMHTSQTEGQEHEYLLCNVQREDS